MFCVLNPCCLVGDRFGPPGAGRQHSGADVGGPREGEGGWPGGSGGSMWTRTSTEPHGIIIRD